MKDIFMFLGIVATASVAIFFICIILTLIKSGISNMIHIYKYKHRFKKKPIATCYCKDCVYWNSETEICGCFKSEKRVGEACFCSYGYPFTKEELEKRNNITGK